MKRRTFIVAVGSTLAWALVADAQVTNQTRRVDGKRRCGRSGRKGASRRLWKGYSSWAGPTAATSRLSTAGLPVALATCASTRQNWSRSRHKSSSLVVGPPLEIASVDPSRAIVFAIVPDPVGSGMATMKGARRSPAKLNHGLAQAKADLAADR